MGILDTAKALRKAQQAKSQMSKISVAGSSKSGLTALLLNGLNEIGEIQFDDELFENADKNKVSKEVMEAFKDARKQLEQELAQSLDINSFGDLFN